MSEELQEHLIREDDEFSKPLIAEDKTPATTYSSVDTKETIPATRNFNWCKSIAQVSSLFYSGSNPFTYVINIPQILPSFINTKKSDLVSADNPSIAYPGYIMAFFSYFCLAYDTYQTYKNYLKKIYGPEEAKEKLTESKQMLELAQSQPMPRNLSSGMVDRITSSIKYYLNIAFKSKDFISPAAKGFSSSWAFGTAFADLMGNKLTSTQHGILATSLNLSTLFFNIYSQKINFDYGKELEHAIEAEPLNINEQDPAESNLAWAKKKCADSFRELLSWENIGFVASIVYAVNNPLTYIKNFQNLFPAIVEDVVNFIKSDSLSKDNEWLAFAINTVCVICYCALAYENVKQYQEMLQRNQRPKARPAPSSEGEAEIMPAKEACCSLAACWGQLMQSPLFAKIIAKLQSASLHTAAVSKGMVSSISLGNFCSQILLFLQCSDKTVSGANIGIILASLFFNIHSQYLTFGIAKKSSPQPIISSGTRLPEQSFLSFTAKDGPIYDSDVKEKKFNRVRRSSSVSSTVSFYQSEQNDRRSSLSVYVSNFSPKKDQAQLAYKEEDHSPDSPDSTSKYSPSGQAAIDNTELSPPKALGDCLLPYEHEEERDFDSPTLPI